MDPDGQRQIPAFAIHYIPSLSKAKNRRARLLPAAITQPSGPAYQNAFSPVPSSCASDPTIYVFRNTHYSLRLMSRASRSTSPAPRFAIFVRFAVFAIQTPSASCLLPSTFCRLLSSFILHPSSFILPSPPSSFILYFKVLRQNPLRLGDFGIIMRDSKDAIYSFLRTLTSQPPALNAVGAKHPLSSRAASPSPLVPLSPCPFGTLARLAHLAHWLIAVCLSLACLLLVSRYREKSSITETLTS